MKTKALSDRTWHGQQSWNREVIETIANAKVRLRVKVDSYDFQSYATAERWTGSEWKTVHRIPGQELRSREKTSAYTRNVQPSAFDEDLAELRAVTKAVLS